jgi:hypothetical protein
LGWKVNGLRRRETLSLIQAGENNSFGHRQERWAFSINALVYRPDDGKMFPIDDSTHDGHLKQT